MMFSIFEQNINLLVLELLIIFILTLLNGFFALSEIALVSVKKIELSIWLLRVVPMPKWY